MVGLLEQIFPGLQGQPYQITSPPDDRYNCIGWAAADTANWWWPDAPELPDSSYWPPAVPRVPTRDAFCAAFATLGYAVCDHDQLEPGHEKIALFALAGLPKHASRQLASGRWTSKLGPMDDIEHGLHDVSGTVYGSVVLLMKRPTTAG